MAPRNVFVINGSAHSPDNDWLVVYDESTGTELERVVLTDIDQGLKSPNALLVSRYYADTLYLTSSIDVDPNNATTNLYVCDLSEPKCTVDGQYDDHDRTADPTDSRITDMVTWPR